MHRLFLDANVLFSAAYREQSGLLRLWSLRDVRLLSSHYAVEEARRNLRDPAQLKRLERLVEALEVASASEDPLPADIQLADKDRPILQTASRLQATHLLTGDLRHFGQYLGRTVLGVLIVTPAQYLQHRDPHEQQP